MPPRSLEYIPIHMEYRLLGKSDFKVPVFTFGTATFGGTTEFFKSWGNTGVAEAKRLIDICTDAGINFFDTANGYSGGASEEILGEALGSKRSKVLISTKATFSVGDAPDDFGSSKKHILRECERSLKRLRTDYIDLYYMHGFDGNTPMEETLETLNSLVKSGKVRQIGCSNFSGWHLMKALSISEKNNWKKYIAHQVYYSLVGRDLEWELIPLAHDQGIGNVIWSPLAGGALTGKFRKGKPAPANSRIGAKEFVPYNSELLYKIMDVLDEVSKECGKSVTQVALNWLLQRPTVSSIIIGARNEEQLKHNLGAIGWKLSSEHIDKLNTISSTPLAYPYWHQEWFPELNPRLPFSF